MIKEFQKQHRWLSNFVPCNVNLDGVVYESVEHAYQAAKTINLNERKLFINCTSGQAKRAGRNITQRHDWEEVKIKVMNDLLKQKFSKEPYKTLLAETGIQHIQEGNRWNDKFWGVCLKTGEGRNELGLLIMAIREENLQGEKS